MRTFLLQPPDPVRKLARARKREIDRPPAAYLVALLAVASAMILIPLSYAGIVGGALWILKLHIMRHTAWLIGPEAGFVNGCLYVVPALALASSALFLIRPLFSRPPSPRSDMSLDPLTEPRLHAFISEICKSLGAPVPGKILVNMDVNASARFAPGLSNLFTGRLELTLGLPLVRGLEVGQFAGVLAHEFGHFSQGAAMRLVYGIRAINHWFARAAGRKDYWDAALARWAGNLDPLLGVLCQFVRACAWMSRGILRLHMHAGQAISCLLLKQMEHQADRAAVRLVGGETFAGMVLEAKILESAWGLASRSLGMALREGRLADDLPSLVAAHTRIFIPEVKKKMEQSLLQEKSAWFDTHPSLGERVVRARRKLTAGMFRASGPASSLFGDFTGLARNATELFYRQDLGDEFEPSRMLSTSELVVGQSEVQVGESAVTGYFLGLVTNLRPLWPRCEDWGAPVDSEATRSLLRQARARIELDYPRACDLHREYAEADGRLLDGLQAGVLTRAKFQVEPGDFQLARGGLVQAQDACRDAEARQRRLAGELADIEEAMRIRLISALRLLSTPEAMEKLMDAENCSREVARQLPVLAALGRIQPRLEALRRSFHSMSALVENLPGNESVKEVQAQMRSLSLAINVNLHAIRDGLGDQPYPFGLAGPEATLAAYAMDALPPEEDYEAHYLVAEKAIARLYALYFRILGRLALAAGRVEGALGLGPLEVAYGAYDAGVPAAISTSPSAGYR